MPITMELIRQLIEDHVAPEDVFSYQALRRWAISRGFIDSGEQERWYDTVIKRFRETQGKTNDG